MKTMLISVLVLGVCGVLAAAQTTQPVASVINIPTTPSATVQRVVVLPFEVMGDVSDHAWAGRAIQHSLAAEVARLSGMSPVTVEAGDGPLNTAKACDTAKAVGADFVIFGDCQFSDASVRITGEIINVSTGQTVAGLKVSGNFRDLFAMEDAVGTQVRRALHPPTITISGGALPDQSAIFTDPAPSPDDVVVDAPNPNDMTDDYNRYYYGDVDYNYTPYGYGGSGYYGGDYGYGYGYGGYGQQIIIIRHNHNRDDRDGRNHNNGSGEEMHGPNAGYSGMRGSFGMSSPAIGRGSMGFGAISGGGMRGH